MEDKQDLRNTVSLGRELIQATTEAVTIPSPWDDVDMHECDQRDIDAQIEREIHDYERRCRIVPLVADQQKDQAASSGTLTPENNAGAIRKNNPPTPFHQSTSSQQLLSTFDPPDCVPDPHWSDGPQARRPDVGDPRNIVQGRSRRHPLPSANELDVTAPRPKRAAAVAAPEAWKSLALRKRRRSRR